MSIEPSFKGIRSPEAPRHDWIAGWTERIVDARKTLANPVPRSPEAIAQIEQVIEHCKRQLAINEGELGQAWDHLAVMLAGAETNQHIQKNKGAMELLAIMRNIAEVANGDDCIDALLDHLTPVFRSQQAWLNQQAKIEKYKTAKRWFIDRVFYDPKVMTKSNNQLAKDWAPKIKEKFGLTVAESTISREWLKAKKYSV